jgi:hypothetical protein
MPARFRYKQRFSPALATMALCPALALGSLKDDVGFTALAESLGANLPDGSGVAVFHVEATSGGNWVADSSNGEFSGKTIVQLSTLSPAPSNHATNVGKLFYGNSSSLSPNIIDIGSYQVEDWVNVQLASGLTPALTNRRIANHSWVDDGTIDLGVAAQIFALSDWYSDNDELIQVFGSNNNESLLPSADRALMASSYNGIVAGVSDGTHSLGVVAVDAIYVGGRAPVHLVSPASTTSRAAPTIASAAALLISAAQSNTGWSQSSTLNRLGTTIYNAERTETIKAALMAGAARSTNNTTAQGNIVDYRYHTSQQTDNGLDWRYGAGQLNVNNSYAILEAGEKSSIEDGGSNNIGFTGFDHNEAFGGSQSNEDIAIYDLGTTTKSKDLTVSLVWNLDVSSANNFSNPATLYNIDLELFDVDSATVVASSTSSIDNSENIWFTLEPNTRYQLRVSKAASQSNFNFDYSIAWLESAPTIIINVPLPPLATFGLLFTLSLLYRYRKTV